jgi:hypothetical protein
MEHVSHEWETKLLNAYFCERFQFITGASVRVSAFWDIALCSLVEVYRRFRGASPLPPSASMACSGTVLLLIFIVSIYILSYHVVHNARFHI